MLINAEMIDAAGLKHADDIGYCPNSITVKCNGNRHNYTKSMLENIRKTATNTDFKSLSDGARLANALRARITT